jgi:hypothetical protein
MSAAFVPLISLVLGAPAIRLAALWHRTRLAPEGLLAIFFGCFAIGAPLRLYTASNGEALGDAVFWPSTIGMMFLAAAVCGLTWFTRAVFRPNSGFARAYAWTMTAFISLTVVGLAVIGQIDKQMHPLSIAANAWTLPLFWWAFVECVSSYRRMRRQAMLGLGDPLVRNRFLLWAVWTCAFCVLPTAVLVVKLSLFAVTPAGEVVTAPPFVMMFIRTVAVSSATCAGIALWLSFFPPAAYVARIRAGATRSTSA